MFHTLKDFLLYNGVGQNMTAGIAMGIPAGFYTRYKFLKHIAEVHAHIHKNHSELIRRGKV